MDVPTLSHSTAQGNPHVKQFSDQNIKQMPLDFAPQITESENSVTGRYGIFELSFSKTTERENAIKMRQVKHALWLASEFKRTGQFEQWQKIKSQQSQVA